MAKSRKIGSGSPHKASGSKDAHKTPEKAGSVLAKITQLPYPFLLLAAVAGILYARTLVYPLGSFDEHRILIRNSQLLAQTSSLPRVLSTDPYFNTKGIGVYRPVQNVSYFLDRQLFGSAPFAHRISNLVLHWLTCCMFFSLLELLAIDRFVSLAAALLYCVHPLFASTVVWMPARGDLLITLFSVLAVIGWLRFSDSLKNQYLVLHLVAFALAVFTKETSLLLPLLVVYIAVALRNRKPSLILMVAVGFFYVLSIVAYLFLRQKVLTGGATDDRIGIGPLLDNLAVLPETVAKFFVPLHLSLMSSFTFSITLVGCLLLAVLMGLAAWFFRQRSRRNLGLGGLGLVWFGLFTVPGMAYQFFLLGTSYDYLEHRTYLPMIGLVIFLLALIPQDWVVRRIESYVPYVVAVLCLFAFLAFRSSLHFENPVAFYKQAIATNPRNALAYNNLAHFEFSKGAYQSAISNFGAAIELNSHYADPICSRGAAYGTIGKYQESLADLNRCIQLESEYPDAHYNRARSHIQLNNLPAAIEDLNKVIRMRPRDALAYYYRGTTKQQMQDLASACDDWRTALELGEGRATQLLHANCR